MLFLTVPGGTASLQRGLFMGSPGMYIRGFLGREEALEWDEGCLELMWSHQGLPSACVSVCFSMFYLCEDRWLGFILQSEDIWSEVAAGQTWNCVACIAV